MTAFLTLVEREVRRFMHVFIQTLLIPMVNAFLYIVIFGVRLGQNQTLYHGNTYLAFLIPGLVYMGALNNSFQNVSSSIIGSRFHGDLQDLKLIPLSPWQMAWAFSTGALIRGILVAMATTSIAVLTSRMVEGQWTPVFSFAWCLFFLFLGCLSFAQLGLLVGFRARNFEQLNAIGSFVLLPLLYLGGVFFSMEGLHPFWQMVGKVNPLYYLVMGFRYGWIGNADIPVEQCALVACLGFLLLHGLAVRAIQKGHFGRW